MGNYNGTNDFQQNSRIACSNLKKYLFIAVLFLFNYFKLVPNCKLRRRPSGLEARIFKNLQKSTKIIRKFYFTYDCLNKSLKCKDLD